MVILGAAAVVVVGALVVTVGVVEVKRDLSIDDADAVNVGLSGYEKAA